MYRVQNQQDYAPENQNMANLAGVMWYLHNEIVNNRWHRRYGKTRVQRFQVTTKATQPLANSGMNFGVRYAFDSGNCTGPFNCTEQFEKYGYFVGCNRVAEFPTQQWRDKVFYRDAVWYSLPGHCPTRSWHQHDGVCHLSEPGGHCAGVPTGQGNCTYSVQPAGEVSIDEIEGIADFGRFAAAGGWEYNNQTDRGIGMTFWDKKYNASACDRRMKRVAQLFAQRYPDAPALSAPACDFTYHSFYAGSSIR